MKKKIPFILLILMLFTFAVPALAPQTAHASGVNAATYTGLECFTGYSLDFGGCVALTGYYLLYIPTSWLLYVSATVFDSTMAFTLSTATLNAPFVVSTWSTVRDVANLAFIFILLYIAIGTILQVGGIDLKKTLVRVILIALVMNFSLFFTRVIIDASNVFANEFYTAVGSPSPTAHISPSMGVPERSIAAGFVGAFNPQTMISPKMYTAWAKGDNFNKSSMFIIFLFGAIVNVVAAYVFFYAGFLMVTRVVMFLFLSISSPIAFIAYALPKGGTFASKWWGHLTDQALLAPVFLFFIYIIAEMIKPPSFIAGIFTQGSSFSEILMKMVLNFVVIIAALLIALKVAKKLSGDAGAMAMKFAANPAMARLKSGRNIALRHTVGRAASSIAASDKVRSIGRRMPAVGMAIDTTLNKMGSGKYNKYQKDSADRKTKYGHSVTKETDRDISNRKGVVLRKEETLQKQGVSDEQIKAINLKDKSESKAKEVVKERQKQYAESITYSGEAKSNTQKTIKYIGKKWQKVSGSKEPSAIAAKKVIEGKNGEGSKADKVKKLLEEITKENNSK